MVASETSAFPCLIVMSRPSRTWCRMCRPDTRPTSAPEVLP
nr:MAG TPA: hypothetical protein [Caudoviricetes sp.]DAW27000.1 MAG TPA: hypothetical protein [Caudoviricetes sp.]